VVLHPDHVTVVVRDADAAKAFFALLGFEHAMSTVISGSVMDSYMGVPGMEAEHVTLVLKGSAPRFEIQLLKYRRPDTLPDAHIRSLNKVGFNHLCFAVDDIEREVARLETHGVKLRNRVMSFHGRKLVFVEGPEGITIELAQWVKT
jgi:catechol 2,3-dioxygenase-like lactoylglutathione lyase family enzyme